MAFVQLIEFRTDDIDKAREIDEEWLQATVGRRTVRRELVTQDRSDPGRYFILVFFDSYESAMENSRRAETQATAERYMKITTGPAVFSDLDVIGDLAV